MKDHNSSGAHNYLESTQDELVESLQRSLPIPEPPERTERDEAQITSLVRALLELSDNRVNDQQHGFAEECTASENTDLCASVLSITRTNQFGDFDLEDMRNTLLTSPVFSGMTFSTRDLERRIMKMLHYFGVSFREGYLVRSPEGRPSSILI